MNGNYVINIGHQLGSGGKEIGEKLAARLVADWFSCGRTCGKWLQGA